MGAAAGLGAGWAAPAWGQETPADPELGPEHGPEHGIAMHGPPALPAGFAHLPYANPAAPKGGELVQAVIGSFDSFNQFGIFGTPAQSLGLVFDQLMTRSWDEPFTLYNQLAARIAVPPDRSSLTVWLHPAARFHDDTPLTVADLRFTFDLLKAQGKPGTRRLYGLVARVEEPEPGCVRFVLGPGADRETVLILGLMPVLARRWWEGRRFDAALPEPPLGSGPYRIGAAALGRQITYERVSGYWGRDLPVARGLNNVDRMRFEYFRDDTVALEALRSGYVNLRRELDPLAFRRLADLPMVAEGRLKRERLAHGRPEPLRGFVFNLRRPPFDDRRVRQALALAFDRATIHRQFLGGLYQPTQSLFPNSELAAGLVPPLSDASGAAGERPALEEALRLLNGAGFTDDGRGRLVRAGRPLAFDLTLSEGRDERFALAWARSLARLGVEARVRQRDPIAARADIDQRRFEVTVGQWISTLSPGAEQLTYWGSAAAGAAGSRNVSGLESPAVDRAIARLGQARGRAQLVEAARALDRAVMAQVPIVPFFHVGHDMVAYGRDLAHPQATPLYGPVFEAWWRQG